MTEILRVVVDDQLGVRIHPWRPFVVLLKLLRSLHHRNRCWFLHHRNWWRSHLVSGASIGGTEEGLRWWRHVALVLEFRCSLSSLIIISHIEFDIFTWFLNLLIKLNFRLITYKSISLNQNYYWYKNRDLARPTTKYWYIVSFKT